VDFGNASNIWGNCDGLAFASKREKKLLTLHAVFSPS
jgi:hypothetical protein